MALPSGSKVRFKLKYGGFSMKMGVGTRILFTLVMLFIIFVSLVIIGVSFGLIPAESAQELLSLIHI